MEIGVGALRKVILLDFSEVLREIYSCLDKLLMHDSAGDRTD